MANLSFAECSFPTAFKTAQVLPLLKKPGLDKVQMSSYRPISNLTTISKVIERLVLETGCGHTCSHLRTSHDCSQRTVMNTVYAAADAKKITALVGLDISAAFDTTDHDVLASRLESQFGVVGATSSWLRSYLRGR